MYVKWEVFDAYIARGLVDPVGQPGDSPRVIDEDIGIDDSCVVTRIRAEKEGENSTKSKDDKSSVK